jgi:transcription elongation factor Elf1
MGDDAVTESGGDVGDALACPRCGASDVDDLLLEDPAEDDEDQDRLVVTCEKCGLRYRLPP